MLVTLEEFLGRIEAPFHANRFGANKCTPPPGSQILALI